jgi:hypothetical protein
LLFETASPELDAERQRATIELGIGDLVAMHDGIAHERICNAIAVRARGLLDGRSYGEVVL